MAWGEDCFHLTKTKNGWSLSSGNNCPGINLNELSRRKAEMERDYVRYQREFSGVREIKCRMIQAMNKRCGDSRDLKTQSKDLSECSREWGVTGNQVEKKLQEFRFAESRPVQDNTAVPGVHQKHLSKLPASFHQHKAECSELISLRYQLFPADERIESKSPESYFANKKSCERSDYRNYIEKNQGWDAVHGVCVHDDRLLSGLLSRLPIEDTNAILQKAAPSKSEPLESWFLLAESATLATERLIEDMLPLYEAAISEARTQLNQMYKDIDLSMKTMPERPIRKDTDHLGNETKSDIRNTLIKTGGGAFKANLKRSQELSESAREVLKEISKPITNDKDATHRLTYLMRNNPALMDGLIRRLNDQAKKDPSLSKNLSKLKKKLCTVFESVRSEKGKIETAATALNTLGWVADGVGVAFAFTGVEVGAAAGFAAGSLSRMGGTLIESLYEADINAYRAVMLSALSKDAIQGKDPIITQHIDAFIEAKNRTKDQMSNELIQEGIVGTIGLLGRGKMITAAAQKIRKPAEVVIKKTASLELETLERSLGETLQTMRYPNPKNIQSEILEALSKQGLSGAKLEEKLRQVISKLSRCQ